MFQRLIHNTFICLDDITGCCVDLNTVIYNPNVDDIDTRKERLRKSIYDYYNFDLTDEQLDSLTKYESDQLVDFVNDLKLIISNR